MQIFGPLVRFTVPHAGQILFQEEGWNSVSPHRPEASGYKRVRGDVFSSCLTLTPSRLNILCPVCPTCGWLYN